MANRLGYYPWKKGISWKFASITPRFPILHPWNGWKVTSIRWPRNDMEPTGWVRLSALLQGGALLESLSFSAVASLLSDAERKTTLTALALKFSSTETWRKIFRGHGKGYGKWPILTGGIMNHGVEWVFFIFLYVWVQPRNISKILVFVGSCGFNHNKDRWYFLKMPLIGIMW